MKYMGVLINGKPMLFNKATHLGNGNFGTVYDAHTIDGSHFALKLEDGNSLVPEMKAAKEEKYKMLKELGRLENENHIQLYSMIELDFKEGV